MVLNANLQNEENNFKSFYFKIEKILEIIIRKIKIIIRHI